MRYLVTHVEDKEECPWMMHQLTQVDWEDKEDKEWVDQ